ncbi:hypothetical protein, partial [Escherichia coli]|uniref:hypothetical protein n=1 Tax=Escherichia coli TaxID=562 RepID=UPI0020240141
MSRRSHELTPEEIPNFNISFSEFPYYNVGDITSAKGYPHYDWPATYAVSLFINNLYTVTSLIVK